MKFKVGSDYEWYQREYGEIEVIKRTDKTITVMNEEGNIWRMKIRTDNEGDEFVIDTTVPERWREAFTCSSKWEV